MTQNPHPFSTNLDQERLTPCELSRLLSTEPNGQFRAIVRASDASTCATLESAGFVQVRRTTEGLVQLSDADHFTFSAAHTRVANAGLSIGLLAGPLLEDWLFSHERAYRRCHDANPLAPLNDADRKSFFADDLQLDAAFAVCDGTQVIAHASLRADPDSWAFGWFGADLDGPICPETLNNALKHLELDFALRMGLRTLWFEHDSTDPQAMSMASHLPIRQPEIWFTYQTKARFDADL